MEAKRLILETDAAGNLKQVPKLPPNQQVEAIFLLLPANEEIRESPPQRQESGKAYG